MIEHKLSIVLLCAVLLSACAAPAAPPPTALPAPTIISTARPFPTPAPPATPTEVPVPTATEAPTPVVERAPVAPELAGATYDPASGTYIAEAGNPWGMQAGEVAGRFWPEVMFEGQKTGGVVVEATVGKALLDATIAKFPKQEDKWAVLVPIDPTTVKDLKLRLGPESGYYKIPSLIIEFVGQTGLFDIIPYAHDLRGIPSINEPWAVIDKTVRYVNTFAKMAVSRM